MSICSNFNRKDTIKEGAITLFISAVQAAPETIPKGLSSEEYVKYLIAGAEKLIEYIEPGKTA